VVNILTSPAEFTCEIYYDAYEHPFLAGFTGSAKGAWLTVRRLLVGTAEILTFMVPGEPMIDGACNKDAWHTFKKDQPKDMMMTAYKTLHTGPKSHAGGAHNGLINDWYQSSVGIVLICQSAAS